MQLQVTRRMHTDTMAGLLRLGSTQLRLCGEVVSSQLNQLTGSGT